MSGLKHADFEGDNAIGAYASFGGEVFIGRGTTIGDHNFIHGPATIGRYCQFGPYAALYGQDHPTSHATAYVNQYLLGGQLRKYIDRARIGIDNDVWLGHGAVVLKGVTIGDGAIIGAGSVVTRDVPPYTIVAGNPAHIIRRRFRDDVNELLLVLKWWDWPVAEMEDLRGLFCIDLSKEPDRGVNEILRLVHTRCNTHQ